MRVKITIEYEYQGDAETLEEVKCEEETAWYNGDVTLADVVGCDDPSNVVTIMVTD